MDQRDPVDQPIRKGRVRVVLVQPNTFRARRPRQFRETNDLVSAYLPIVWFVGSTVSVAVSHSPPEGDGKT